MACVEKVLPSKSSAGPLRVLSGPLTSLLLPCAAVAMLAVGTVSVADIVAPPKRSPAIDLRVQKWHGPALCYSGYRPGQHPDEHLYPTQAQVLEDMRIVERHWRLIRMYGADRHTEDVLEVIRREKVNLKMMLGIWLDGRAAAKEKTAREIATGIRLANAYPDVVVAVSVGNEALASFMPHFMPEEQLIEHVKAVRRAVRCPVTVDDFASTWSDARPRLVDAVDFISMHTYPIWGGADIDQGLSGTVADYESVRRAHPAKPIVIGEAGWATYTVGEKHAPRAGSEVKQQRYFEELSAWSKANDVTVFFFDAFDEPWKGKGTEGHWGLFSEGRKAKPAMRELFPDLTPTGPTSPSYDGPQPVVP